METSNKVVLLLIVCLSSRLVAGISPSISIAEQPASAPASAPSGDGPPLLQTSEDPLSLLQASEDPALSSRLVAGISPWISIAEQPASAPASAPSGDGPPLLQTSEDPLSLLQASEDPAILKACEATGYPLLCLSSIAPFYTKGAFDPDTLIANEIAAALVRAKSLLAESKKIAKDPSTPSGLVESLDYCRENFESAVEDLREATNGIDIRDIGLMNSMLSSVITDVSTCEDTFSELGTGASPLADNQETLKNMASNCLAILDYLHW